MPAPALDNSGDISAAPLCHPQIFFYDVFKAEAKRQGDFGDFLYMAARHVLTTHGIHPARVTLREGQLIPKLPMEVGY